MEGFSSNTSNHVFLELANDPEFCARSEARNCQGQQWFRPDAFEETPYQLDYHSPDQPLLYSPTQPTFYPPIQQHFYPQDQFQSPLYDQFLFQNSDSIPNSQISAYGNLQFQNQQPIFYPQPHAQTQNEHGYCPQHHSNMDFQQEAQQYIDPPPPLFSEGAFAALMEALKPSSEWSSKQRVETQNEVEARESKFFKHEAGSSVRSLESVVEDNREEEENGIVAMDRAWDFSQKAEVQGVGIRKEQFREEEDHEQGEMGERKKSLPWLFLHTEQDKLSLLRLPLQNKHGITSKDAEETSLWERKDKEEAEQDKESLLCLPLHTEHELPLQSKHGVLFNSAQSTSPRAQHASHLQVELEFSLLQPALAQQQGKEERKKLEEENNLSLLLRKEEAIADTTCGFHPQSAHGHQEAQQQRQQEGYEGVEEERRLRTVAHSSLPFRKEEEVSADSNGLFLQSAQDKHEERREVQQLDAPNDSPLLELLQAAQDKNEQQQEEGGGNKKLDALQFTLLAGEKEATMEDLACAALDTLMHKAHHLMQHGISINEAGEREVSCQQLSPHSMKPLRIKEKGVQDLAKSDFHFLPHEEGHISDGQHQTTAEKEEEQKGARAPDLLKKEAAEPLHHPQVTTPRQMEEAAYPSNLNCLSFAFTLTNNHYSLVVNVCISGDKLQTQQLSFTAICKLQSIEVSGDVHKKGTRGDGVLWFIKVHPP